MVEPLGFRRNQRPGVLPRTFRDWRSARQRATGAATAELPVVLLVLFLLLAFPMLNLATSALRAYFLRSAVLEAAHKAAKACTFESNITPNPPDEPGCESAKTIAGNTLDRFAAGFQGISIDSKDIKIVRQDAQNGTEESFAGKLGEVDSEKYLYYVEVQITGKADPLISMKGTIVPDIGGLTGPMNLKLGGRELFEQVEGLTQ